MFRRNVKMKDVSRQIFAKYMLNLKKKGETNISKLLWDRFVVVSDGWSHGAIIYVSVFALVPNNLAKGFMGYLLDFLLMGNRGQQ